jgi:hypothetical protein
MNASSARSCGDDPLSMTVQPRRRPARANRASASAATASGAISVTSQTARRAPVPVSSRQIRA